MNVQNRKPQFLLLLLVFVVLLIAFFIFKGVIDYSNRPVEKIQNVNVKDNGLKLEIVGDYLTYCNINEKCVLEGAKAFIDGADISDKVIVSYYKDDKQVSSIDTTSVGEYIVRYDVLSNNKSKFVTRVLLVTDNKAPKLTMPATDVITTDEVVNYDVEEGVLATDNAGEVSFECINTLSAVAGDYIITCVAKDRNGNKSEENRLIKVIDGIEFEYNKKLSIKYPAHDKKNYIYKYSLDGGLSWKDASVLTSLDVNSGSVIALVLENDKYVMSSTYYIK